MNRSVSIALLISILCAQSSFAQPGRCPKFSEEYVWETPEDYEKDKEQVKKTLRWLCVTPIGMDIQQRSIANAYVLEWLAGTPSFTIDIKTDYLSFVGEHPELLYTFIHAVGYYKMDHPEEESELKLYSEGFKVVANLSSQSKELSKSSLLKPLLKAARRNTIREYTKETLGIEKP